MDRWSSLTLRDAGVKLIDCVHKTPAAQESGYPYVGIPQMRDGWIDFDNARKISREDFCEWTKKAKPQQHDVVLSRRTNPGVTAIDRTSTDFALGQNLVLLRADGCQIDPPFLKWLARSPAWWKQIEKFKNVGAVFDSLKCADVPNFELPVPPIKTQRMMGGLLDAIDVKIDLNRRMNETLEAMARAIFKDWFVDFGPTRAKAEGRAPYLAPELWDLFPDALDDEGKPVGWQDISIYEFSDVVYGAPFASKQFSSEKAGVPLIRIRDLATHSPGVSTEQVHKKGHVIQPGDIVVGMDGEFRLEIWKGPEGWLNQRVCHFEPKPKIPKSYLSEALKEPLAFFERGKTGTTVIHLAKSDIDTFKLTHPGDFILEAFAELVEPLLCRTVSNALESRTLARVRDLLLPKLMSAEIRLPDADRAVKAVV